MSSDDYQVQNIYRYSRKTFKKNRRPEESINLRDDHVDSPRIEPKNEGIVIDSPAATAGCSCDFDSDGDIASILHKKCPVISLAQQQLQRLLDETDKLLCDNTRCCRSLYDFFCVCKELLATQNKGQYALLMLIGIAFVIGLVLGAASCGSYLGHFNSPILSCIDSFFIPDSYASVQDSFRSII